VWLALSPLVSCGDEDIDTFPVIKSYQLPDPAYEKWDEIETYWFKKVYRKVLTKYHLKLSCANCQYIYYTVILYVSKDGKLIKHKKLKENVCSKKGPKGLLEDLLKYFKELQFPKELRGIGIEVRLGTGLKC
jgi:hypothetical protein